MAVDAELNGCMLYVGTHGMEDPMRAGLLFAAANAAKRNYPAMPVVVALLGDAVFLLIDKIASETVPMGGRGTLLSLIEAAVRLKIRIFC